MLPNARKQQCTTQVVFKDKQGCLIALRYDRMHPFFWCNCVSCIVTATQVLSYRGCVYRTFCQLFYGCMQTMSVNASNSPKE